MLESKVRQSRFSAFWKMWQENTESNQQKKQKTSKTIANFRFQEHILIRMKGIHQKLWSV